MSLSSTSALSGKNITVDCIVGTAIDASSETGLVEVFAESIVVMPDVVQILLMVMALMTATSAAIRSNLEVEKEPGK